MENPIKMDDLGVLSFLETPIWNHHLENHLLVFNYSPLEVGIWEGLAILQLPNSLGKEEEKETKKTCWMLGVISSGQRWRMENLYDIIDIIYCIDISWVYLHAIKGPFQDC